MNGCICNCEFDAEWFLISYLLSVEHFWINDTATTTARINSGREREICLLGVDAHVYLKGEFENGSTIVGAPHTVNGSLQQMNLPFPP